MGRLNVTNLRRLVLMFLALPVTGFAVALFERAGFGTDPFTCMNMGIAARVGLSFGTWQLIMNGALLAVVFLMARHLIGIATFANMSLIGFTVDLIDGAFPVIVPESLLARLALMLAGVVIVSFGTALYSRSGLGVSPYDAVWFIVTHRTKKDYHVCKIVLDCIVTAVGFVSGSVMGLATIVTALFMGPLISWFNLHVCGPLLHASEYEEAEAL